MFRDAMTKTAAQLIDDEWGQLMRDSDVPDLTAQTKIVATVEAAMSMGPDHIFALINGLIQVGALGWDLAGRMGDGAPAARAWDVMEKLLAD